MKMVVHKFEVPLNDAPVVRMQEKAQILHFGAQNGCLYLWALVDAEAPLASREFVLRGTGQTLDVPAMYVGTAMLYDGAFVAHLFDPVRSA